VICEPITFPVALNVALNALFQLLVEAFSFLRRLPEFHSFLSYRSSPSSFFKSSSGLCPLFCFNSYLKHSFGVASDQASIRNTRGKTFYTPQEKHPANGTSRIEIHPANRTNSTRKTSREQHQ
jgi:hypothetical protein